MPDYTAKDFVKVKDAEGRVQENGVPKAWIGTALLPDGWKAASAKDVEADDTEAVEDSESDKAPDGATDKAVDAGEKADTKTGAKPSK